MPRLRRLVAADTTMVVYLLKGQQQPVPARLVAADTTMVVYLA